MPKSQKILQIAKAVGDTRTEFNRILCTSKSEAAVTSNKKLRCMLKLTTDKLEASHSLSATAELLVSIEMIYTVQESLLLFCTAILKI